MQVQIRRCAVIARMPIQPKQTSVFGKRVFDGAKVVRRVEGFVRTITPLEAANRTYPGFRQPLGVWYGRA